MTLVRKPLTVEEALDRVLGTLTMKGAIEATGRKEHYLRALSHPEKRESLTVADLIKLDVSHMQVDGTTPIFETVGLILKSMQAEMFADEAQLASMSIEMIRENTDAEIAVLEATRPDASPEAWLRAEKELPEAISTAMRLLAFVRRKRERATGPPTTPG